MGQLVTVVELQEKLSPLRGKSKIVFTNGCFDILHVGHVRYLQQAKSLGDLLVIGLNADASVKRLKGPDRPIQSQADRAEVLCALNCVDFVCVFDQDTPYDLIKSIRPNILVKGGDWPVEKIIGSDVVLATGGKVQSLPFHEGRSTTKILEKILSLG